MSRLRYILAILGLAGCGNQAPSLQTRYDPLHPANNTNVEFRIQAQDKDGIGNAKLYVYEYEFFTSNTGMQSARRRTGGRWGLQREWNFPTQPTTIDEKESVSGFPAGSYISYLAQVSDSKGATREEQWYFAAGTWPFGNSPIPLLANGAPAHRIDVAFVADRGDFAAARDMLPRLAALIFDGYHTNNVVRRGKGMWQFYYSPERGFISDFDDGSPFTLDVPASVTNSGIIDHAAIIHTTTKRDWASGGNFGTEPQNRGTAVHESGHAAFGLADEYDGGGHFTSSDPYHNNYSSANSCQNYNQSHNWPGTDCEAIQTGWWRPEPNGLQCIMVNDGDAAMPDFERSCSSRATWYYLTLEGS